MHCQGARARVREAGCGGLRDETDLRGHNRTWKDAQPGVILRELRRVGSKDPVIVLDELDKLGREPAEVLLEVLDPAQNVGFRDAFVELPFDLSEVLFITTANEPDRIPPALRDRLELVELPGYTEAEKVAIARDASRRRAEPRRRLDRDAGAADAGRLPAIIRDYTSERGVRQLTRCLRTICRKVALGLDRRRGARPRAHRGATATRVSRRAGRRTMATVSSGCDRGSTPAACRAGAGPAGSRPAVAVAPADPEHVRTREYLRACRACRGPPAPRCSSIWGGRRQSSTPGMPTRRREGAPR